MSSAAQNHSSPQAPAHDSAVLALDTASPVVSVAVVQGGRTLAQEAVAQRQSSRILLGLVDRVLERSNRSLDDLGGLVAVQGPGSFTGLRVGLATVLGLHQATRLPATALPTLEVLAATVHDAPEVDIPGLELPSTVVAVVDARRGEFFSQRFAMNDGETDRGTDRGTLCPLEEPCRRSAEELAGLGVEAVTGFGLEALRQLPQWNEQVRWVEPAALAATAGRLAAAHQDRWQPRSLTQPLYLEAPAVSQPRS